MREGDQYIQVFLDLTQAYDALDRSRILRLLKDYGMGPNVLNYIETIWEKLVFVPKQTGCYGDEFDVDCGVTQGDPDSPIIFNVIVDAVIRMWELEFIEENIDNNKLYLGFYADDGLLAGQDADEIKIGLEKLEDLFGRLGLKMNDSKTKYMVTEGKIRGKMSKAAYSRMITGRGETHKERRKEKIQCRHCEMCVTRAAMNKHCRDKHEGATDNTDDADADADKAEGDYTTKMPRGREKRGTRCPVPDCEFRAQDRYTMYRHFAYRHPMAQVEIDGDGRLPKCGLCGMQSADVQKHQTTKECAKGRKRKKERDRKRERDERRNDIEFKVNGSVIKRVSTFKYLGRVLHEKDDDTACIEAQLAKARERWGMVMRVLKKSENNPKVMGRFYVAVVQAVLLYGAETWVVSDRNMRKLKSFHHKCARMISGKHIRKLPNGTWITPRSERALTEAGLWEVDKYIQRRKSTLQKYAEQREILRTCQDTQKSSSNPNQLVWWG